MKLAEKVLLNIYEKKSHKGVPYSIKKKGNQFYAEIEGEEIEDTFARSERDAEKKTRQFIDSVI